MPVIGIGKAAGIAAFTVAPLLAACGGGTHAGGESLPAATLGFARAGHAGLGKILTAKGGGQIYGFDVDQHGTQGIFASAQDAKKPGAVKVSIQTFEQSSGTILKSFARSTNARDSYAVDGIFGGGTALVTHFIVPKGQIYANRKYETVAPVGAGQFTGKWTPPIADIDVSQGADNQSTSTSVFLAIELKHQDNPDLIVSDVGANTFSNIIKLDPNTFGVGNGPHVAQYAAANQAVLALSPDGGAVHGEAPLNVLVDLSTGKQKQFSGYNNGYYHAGYVNGLAVDPNTGVAVTDTELNAQVEFYDLNKRTGITAVQLPCSGPTSQGNSGAGITVDAVNKLVLVADPFYCNGSQGSALVVYDEAGNVVETITGFTFAIAEPPVAVNPSTRTGWAFGPAFNQLQQFTY